MKITLLAIGKTRGLEAEWCDEYLKRMGSLVDLRTFAAPKNISPALTQKAEEQLLLKAIPPRATVLLLDERGRELTSRGLADKVSAWQDNGVAELAIIIGGADGVTDEVRARADFTLGFGRLTWPHRLVRVMALEQIYRAKQIIAGHPYHRD